MGHWSFSKFSTDYKDERGDEVNQPMLSTERKEEPAEDDEEPTDDEKEAS